MVKPAFDASIELRRIAMARGLDRSPWCVLTDISARARIYAQFGLAAFTADDDADAVRRSLIFRTRITLRALGEAA